MLVKEYRVVLPISVSEYQVAQLWAVAQASKEESGGGEGIEVLKNEPYDEDGESGQYTKKYYRFKSRVPKIFAALAPAGSLDFLEEAWNAYPNCKTVFTNPGYMKDNFEIKIETIHKPDLGESDNVHNLPKSQWKDIVANRGVVHIDIAAPVKGGDYNVETDPTKFKSQKCDRGLLKEGWIDELKAKAATTKCEGEPQYMCAYKLVTCRFKWRLLQDKVESFIHSQETRLFTNFHRQLFCWMDNWYGLNMDDIRRIENETKSELDKLRNTGQLRVTTAVDKL